MGLIIAVCLFAGVGARRVDHRNDGQAVLSETADDVSGLQMVLGAPYAIFYAPFLAEKSNVALTVTKFDFDLRRIKWSAAEFAYGGTESLEDGLRARARFIFRGGDRLGDILVDRKIAQLGEPFVEFARAEQSRYLGRSRGRERFWEKREITSPLFRHEKQLIQPAYSSRH